MNFTSALLAVALAERGPPYDLDRLDMVPPKSSSLYVQDFVGNDPVVSHRCWKICSFGFIRQKGSSLLGSMATHKFAKRRLRCARRSRAKMCVCDKHW